MPFFRWVPAWEPYREGKGLGTLPKKIALSENGLGLFWVRLRGLSDFGSVAHSIG